MSNIPNFETCKKLNKYIKIETENFIDKEGKLYTTKEWMGLPIINPSISCHSRTIPATYPAPTLEELLKVCPISYLEIGISSTQSEIRIYYGFDRNKSYVKHYLKSSNLAQVIAEIILQYYEEQEK